MTRYIYQFVHAASSEIGSSLSEWHLKVIKLSENAETLGDSETVYVSPFCSTRKECEDYKIGFQKSLENDA